jgi:AraC-like DNA-binding protein
LPQAQETYSLTAMARAFGIPPHALKYELARDGTTFSEVLDGYRRDLVLQRLLGVPGMTVEKMADALGFDAPRQFYRRFKAWTGATLSEYKRGGALSN